MKYSRVFVLAFVFFLISSQSIEAQQVIDAFKSLKKIESAVSVGVNHGNYTTLVAEAKTELDMYLLVDSKSDLSKSLYKTFRIYEIANEFWSYRFSYYGYDEREKFSRQHFLSDEEYYRYALYFPLDEAISNNEKPLVSGYSSALRMMAVKILWGEASKELLYSYKLLKMNQK